MKRPEDEFDSLIDSWLDGTIDEPGMTRLNQWIKESPEHADRFAQRSHLHSRLFDWAKTRDARATRKRSIRVRAVLGAAAAVILLLGGVQFFIREEPGSSVATLTAMVEGELRYQGRSLPSGEDIIRTGSYEMNRGLASFRFDNGVEVTLEAPARFRIESALKMILEQGKLSAAVPPEGVGFTVETPAAEVIDFGTEFAVEVNSDRSSEVHVFEGAVDVKPKHRSEAAPVRLLTNGATRVDYQSAVPMGIEIDPDRFLRTLEEPQLTYPGVVRVLDPVVYYRMGLKTFAEGSGIRFVSRGSKKPFLTPGKAGASVRLEGPKDGGFVMVPDYPKSTTGMLSGVCWVYAESRPRKASIATNESESEIGQFGWGLWRDNGNLYIRVKSGGEDVTVEDPEVFPLREWQHLAFVADGEVLRLYRNGKEVGSVPCGTVDGTELRPMVIGARLYAAGDEPRGRQFWHGRIDEFALFERPLTGEQIQNLYHSDLAK